MKSSLGWGKERKYLQMSQNDQENGGSSFNNTKDSGELT